VLVDEDVRPGVFERPGRVERRVEDELVLEAPVGAAGPEVRLVVRDGLAPDEAVPDGELLVDEDVPLVALRPASTVTPGENESDVLSIPPMFSAVSSTPSPTDSGVLILIHDSYYNINIVTLTVGGSRNE
jgi:hypothetical protein